MHWVICRDGPDYYRDDLLNTNFNFLKIKKPSK